MYKSKQNVKIVPIKLNDEQYAQICAKADHENCKIEEIIQQIIETYFHQINGEKVVLDVYLLIEAFDTYNREGVDSERLRDLCEQNKFR